MKKLALICLAAWGSAATAAAQDIVHMKDGSRINCCVSTQSKDPDRMFYTLYGADTVNAYVPSKRVEYIERDGVNMIYSSFGELVPLNRQESPIVPEHRFMVGATVGYAFMKNINRTTWSANAVYYIKNVLGIGVQGQMLTRDSEKQYLVSPYLKYRVPMRVQHFFYIGLAPGVAINPGYDIVFWDNTIAHTDCSVNFGGRFDAGFDVRITRGFYFDCGISWIGFGMQNKETTLLMGLYAGLRFGPEKRR